MFLKFYKEGFFICFMVLVISCSLNPQSKSRVMGKELVKNFKDAEFVDLQDLNLPLCDGGKCYSNKEVIEIGEKIRKAKAVVLAFPVYNYSMAAVAKNLIELTGKAWDGKVFSFVCVAGGRSSYMSPMSLASSLMLDFRSVFIPKYVYGGILVV